MSYSPTVTVTIDLTSIETGLEAEELEILTCNLASELDELVEEVHLVRQSDVPAGSKPGLAAFLIGVLQTEVSVNNLKNLMNCLGERFYGRPLKLEVCANGKSFKLEYCNQQQLQDAILAVEQLIQLA